MTVRSWCGPIQWVGAVAFALLLADSAAAQDVSQRVRHEALRGPVGVQGGARPQVTVEAGEANSQAQVVLGLGPDIQLSVSAPVVKGAEATDFASLSGLAAGLAFGGSLKVVDFGLSHEDAGAPQRQEAVCRKWGLPSRITCSDGELEAYLREQGRTDSEVRGAVLEFDRASFAGDILWAISVDAGISHREFEFFSPEADTAEARRTSGKIGGSVGAIYGPGLVTFGLAFESAHKSQSVTGQVCTVVQTGSTVEACRQLPLGSPVHSEAVITRLQWRHIFGSWALAPAFAWNLDDDTVGLSAPVYFVPNSDGQLLGGVRFSWRSDVEDLRASFFLSKPLAGF